MPPIPQLVPMGLWEDFIGALNTMMQPLYWAVSWIMTSFHTLFLKSIPEMIPAAGVVVSCDQFQAMLCIVFYERR